MPTTRRPPTSRCRRATRGRRAGGLLVALAGFATVAACGSPPPAAPLSAGPNPSQTPSQTPSQSAAPSPLPSSAVAPHGVTAPGAVFGAGCDQLSSGTAAASPDKATTQPGKAALQPVGAAIAANPLLRSLTVALRKANLTDTLDQQHDLTVLAPDDQAFQAYARTEGSDRFYAVLADQNVLADLLKYHVLPSRYDRAGLVGTGSVTTLEGAGLRVRDAGDTVEITDNTGTTARVVCGNIPTANATLFVIDQVLAPRRP